MAIVCNLANNLLRTTSCGYQLSEIVDIFLINYNDLAGTPEITASEVGQDEVTAVTLNSGASVYHIEPAKNSASFEDTLVVEDNGIKYRNASVSFTVAGAYSKVLHASIDALSLGRYTCVLKTAEGVYVMLGRIAPLEAEVVTLAGGSDTNGIQVTLSGNLAESPLTLSDAAVQDVLDEVAS